METPRIQGKQQASTSLARNDGTRNTSHTHKKKHLLPIWLRGSSSSTTSSSTTVHELEVEIDLFIAVKHSSSSSSSSDLGSFILHFIPSQRDHLPVWGSSLGNLWVYSVPAKGNSNKSRFPKGSFSFKSWSAIDLNMAWVLTRTNVWHSVKTDVYLAWSILLYIDKDIVPFVIFLTLSFSNGVNYSKGSRWSK